MKPNKLYSRLFGCMVFNAVFNIISVISGEPVHLSMLSRNCLLISTSHNIISKPLIAFPHNIDIALLRFVHIVPHHENTTITYNDNSHDL